jgi:hypothetical protein
MPARGGEETVARGKGGARLGDYRGEVTPLPMEHGRGAGGEGQQLINGRHSPAIAPRSASPNTWLDSASSEVGLELRPCVGPL